ncbi:hypothetical protein [Streptomyces sp. XY006]|uniref:hypothetical protein n=1 Tax=Streptomyces sp. XY006 TaxID=2021410 RepID=UPI000B8C065B|nr:hypothetical protein [Streptomyces sp. XY006]OXS33941.1 hypothetical protein CHR28_17930 [Streptomyces sp. XY006]
MADIFEVIAAVGVVSSLLIAAWQTRELTRQTKLNNGLAGATATYNGLERLHYVDGFIAEHPSLYEYFYGGAPIPQDPEQRARVMALVNILADSIDYGLMTTAVTPAVLGYEGWREFAVVMRRDCPALVHAVKENPGFYPALVKHWNANPATAL